MSRLLVTAAGVIAVTVLGSCGLNNPLANPGLPGVDAAGNDAKVDALAERIAADYAIAARSLDPTTMRHEYSRQLALSGPPLHGQLVAIGAPAGTEIAELARDRARTNVRLVRTERAGGTRKRATVIVELDERTISTGEVSEREATYRVVVSRIGRDWLITTFTAEP